MRDTMSIAQVLPFAAADETQADLDTVGGKGQSLARMTAAGFAVPAGFTVTTSPIASSLPRSTYSKTIIDLAKPEIGAGTVSFDSASQQIQALFAKSDLSDALKARISEAYAGLGAGEPPVAVRSSARSRRCEPSGWACS